ncbi:hypothetical protein Y1Q_0004422 [Alligator mississippiensis]|uniref:Uncharacterized protein n=1 Tax=Alligator mississippiensis TaxID=8496 RepID=A0A151MW32_ALLMI|nr:hypothetical protein Y1Q_0004422 [Alligator mississippiensis]
MFLALPTNNHPTLALLNLAMPACLWYVGHLFSVAAESGRISSKSNRLLKFHTALDEDRRIHGTVVSTQHPSTGIRVA